MQMAYQLVIWGLFAALSALILRISLQISTARSNRKRAVAFFHPYTNDGGGGERVLWCAVKAIQDENPSLDCLVYTGDHDASPHSLTARAVDRFGVKLLHQPKVLFSLLLFLNSIFIINFRLGFEGGAFEQEEVDRGGHVPAADHDRVYLSWEALTKFTPTLYFDTAGYAFTYPIARLFGCRVICYTHYPTISCDMLSRVRRRSSMYNNDDFIARSNWLSSCKVVYYNIFSRMYGIVGSCAHLVMVNSSWTQSHIEKLWNIPTRTKRVYPPCDTSGLQAHGLQLEAFAVAIGKLDAHLPRPKLQFVGSCRNKADEERLQHLKDKAVELKVDGDVEFHKNVLYRDLVQLLGGAIAGIHSMTDEHFGISVVEYMAAGAIPIAHNSAGPKMDIVLAEDGLQTGFLARTVDEYADAILNVIMMPERERLKMASAARKRAGRYSEQRFYDDFKAAISPVLTHSSS